MKVIKGEQMMIIRDDDSAEVKRPALIIKTDPEDDGRAILEAYPSGSEDVIRAPVRVWSFITGISQGINPEITETEIGEILLEYLINKELEKKLKIVFQLGEL